MNLNTLLQLTGLLTVVFMICYAKAPEVFVVLVLMANQEFFYLLPREFLGQGTYQDGLYGVLLAGLFAAAPRAKFTFEQGRPFLLLVLALLLLVLIGIWTSFDQGQRLINGIKAAKGYYLILFFFPFLSIRINTKRFFDLIVVVGVLLAILNNVQYIFRENLELFFYETTLERFGSARLVIGDFFTIYAPLVGLGQYIRNRGWKYLAASGYMFTTIFIQGQVRAIIIGAIVTVLGMLWLTKRLNLGKSLALGLGLVVIFVWLGPNLMKGRVGTLVVESMIEVAEKTGSVGLRIKGYDYYWAEIMKSPLIGRGVVGDELESENPQNIEEMGIYMSDLGMMELFFHFGALGLLWILFLIFLLVRLARRCAVSIFQEAPEAMGYILFSVVTVATLNDLTARRTVIYLALNLALLCKVTWSKTEGRSKLAKSGVAVGRPRQGPAAGAEFDRPPRRGEVFGS